MRLRFLWTPLILAAPLVASAAPTAIPVDSPAACSACHGAIVTEWGESMHASAHADSDPLFAAMRDLRMKKQGAAVGDKCNQCHTPRSVDNPDAPEGKVGVGCATCHLSTAVDTSAPSRGAARITFADDGVMRGPHDLAAGASPVHGTGPAAAHIADGQTICLACHGEVANPKGAPTCTTGAELSDDAGSCASCHMPMVDGPGTVTATSRDQHRSHAFLGPHRAWLQDDPSFLKGAVAMNASWAGQTVSVVLENNAGHAFPTGFPGRVAIVKAVGKDASGAMVWTNWATNPMKESPESVLGKLYVDAAGKPILPPFADKLARDSRLTGGESRTVTYTVPDTVKAVELRLVYLLLPAPAARALGVTDLPEAKPTVLHSASLTR